MPSGDKDPLDRVFMALTDATRRELVRRLAKSESTINELALGFEISLAAISKHVKVLENAKLVRRRIDGRVHHISLAPEQLTDALDWISIYRNFWQSRFDLLTQVIVNKEDQ